MIDRAIAIIGGVGFVGSRLARRFDLGDSRYTVCDIDLDSRSQDIIYVDVEGRQNSIDLALRNAWKRALLNHVDAGGFVFRLSEQFVYGDLEMSIDRNIGAMLPTWFRVLSVSYLAQALGVENQFVITQCAENAFI